MKRLTRIACLLLAALLTIQSGITAAALESSGAAVPVSTADKQANIGTWYEIFVYSFCDSDGDGIGDLKGVTSKLDYLQELGIQGIWLMPIHPSVTYHKYDVSDYYTIDPQYGTMNDFEEFIAQCRARGIRVILDLVLNHTGIEHPWFREAAQYLQSLPADAEPNAADCPYFDYYFFDKSPSATYYYDVEGTPWKYEGKFWSGMPDLNLENSQLREEIRTIMQYWLDKGVQGFRLDAAREYYSGKDNRNIEVLSFLQSTMNELKPDGYLVAEVWDSFPVVTDYYKSGITSLFNFPFGDGSGKIISVIRGAGNEKTVSSYATALEKADKAFRGSNPDYIDAPFLSNHDTGRIAGFCSGDENRIKLAGAMNLFMSGSVFIYYGEELGMPGSGNDPSKRAPMLWNEARDSGTTSPPPECLLPDSYPLGSLELQQADENSVYSYYRQAIAIRNRLEVISHGIPTAETALNHNCVSAVRKTWQDETCILLMNINTEPAAVDLTGYENFTLEASLSTNGEPITLDGTALSLPPFGTAVLMQQ